MKSPLPFRIRTVTAFLSLQPQDFPASLDTLDSSPVAARVRQASQLLQTMQQELTNAGYEVQTLRIATNPFGEWMTTSSCTLDQSRLNAWNELMTLHRITFATVGSAQTVDEIPLCREIVQSSPSMYCSAHVGATDVAAAQAAAQCVMQIAQWQDGLGNFRFCMSHCPEGIPFFPAAKAASTAAAGASASAGATGLLGFAVGLENGSLAHELLKQCQSIANIPTVFRNGMAAVLTPVQELCQKVSQRYPDYPYLGIDTSLNPSLEEGGSVAEAIECLPEVECFGGPGTLAAAAAITTALQSLPGIQRTGYCGLMLPVCEDQRLAALAETTSTDERRLELADLLSISSVCGVGIDTVPLPGEISEARLTALLLDVAGLAERWNKPLSCRVLPFHGKQAGQRTDFDSPYMVNTDVFSL